MTKATTEGRQLVLAVEGIDRPFRVDPLPARRGRELTELFIQASLNKLSALAGESLFIESIGAGNYSRMAGMLVDEFDTFGTYLRTHDDSDEQHVLPEDARPAALEVGVRFIARDVAAFAGEALPEGEAIRQEEAEALSLCAFYWQTVAGLEAVNMFIEAGEGTTGSLKALALLTSRLGLSPSRTSRSSELENLTQQGATRDTTTPPAGVPAVRLPADRRSPLGRRLGSKKPR